MGVKVTTGSGIFSSAFGRALTLPLYSNRLLSSFLTSPKLSIARIAFMDNLFSNAITRACDDPCTYIAPRGLCCLMANSFHIY